MQTYTNLSVSANIGYAYLAKSDFLQYLCRKTLSDMATHNELGIWGEEYAASYLRSKGYTIEERDWRFGHRDIDIIARTPDNATLVFVEVKTRTNDEVTKPEDAIDIKKIRNIGMAANSYVKQKNVADNLRFDIITIIGNCDDNAQLHHCKDAFNPCLAYR